MSGRGIKDNIVTASLAFFALYYVLLEYLASCYYYKINKIQIVLYVRILRR